MPIPADPELAPRVSELVRHETAAQMADNAMQVGGGQHSLRDMNGGGVYESVSSNWVAVVLCTR